MLPQAVQSTEDPVMIVTLLVCKSGPRALVSGTAHDIKCIIFIVVNVDCRTEIKQGAEALGQKIKTYRPKIAVFNGKGRLHFLS